MGKVAILTDSNSGISILDDKNPGILGVLPQELKDVFIIPMPFYINGELFYENIDITQKEFYEKLKDKDTKITTSMPAIGMLLDKWDELLETYDEILYIPMSSGLSSSCQMATSLASDYEKKVYVVDNHRISVTQKLSVYEALKLANQGKTAKEIKEILEDTKKDSSIYITVATLEYLKKGGRLTPAVAALGGILKVKPVLQIQGEKLDTYAVSRTMRQAKTKMIAAVKKDMKSRFNSDNLDDYIISVAHTDVIEEAKIFRDELLKEFPNQEIIIDPLSLSVSCHIGPGALAVTISLKHNF